MMLIDRLVEDALEEELDRAPALEADFSALSHAIGQVWRDMPPELKAYLIGEGRRLLRQLREDPAGLLPYIASLAGWLIVRRGLSPPKAVRTATTQVVRQRGRGRALRRKPLAPVPGRRRPPPPRPLAKKRWQRGRRGSRFESWD